MLPDLTFHFDEDEAWLSKEEALLKEQKQPDMRHASSGDIQAEFNQSNAHSQSYSRVLESRPLVENVRGGNAYIQKIFSQEKMLTKSISSFAIQLPCYECYG